MLGVMCATRDEHVWATDVIETVSAVLVRHAIEHGEGVEPVIREAMASAIEAAEQLGFSAEEAVSAVARGALRAAGSYGPEMQQFVQATVPQVVRGVRVALPRPTAPAALVDHPGRTA
jgi:hypothetical protein